MGRMDGRTPAVDKARKDFVNKERERFFDPNRVGLFIGAFQLPDAFVFDKPMGKGPTLKGFIGPLYWIHEEGIGWVKDEGVNDLREYENVIEHMEAGRVKKAFGPIYIPDPV